MTPGTRVTLAIERPAVGGRMIARHGGAVVLVSGAIPGETVEAEVEKIQRRTVWARTARVLSPSPDRVAGDQDAGCGGNVLAHVRYERQIAIKRAMIEDALSRIGHLKTPESLAVAPSPVEGYRMRARLHVERGRIGFYREGTHALCDPRSTRQLRPDTLDALTALEQELAGRGMDGVAGVELAENVAADERALHLELREPRQRHTLAGLPQIHGVSGLSCESGRGPLVELWGRPEVNDTFVARARAGAVTITVSRHVQSFFQGNRFLLASLVASVLDAVPSGRTLDLYAGVGLFAAALVARGDTSVIAVEGDERSARDLRRNLASAGAAVEAHHSSVERFVAAANGSRVDTIVVDPPRTGLSAEALRGVAALTNRIVYVSCDVATLARDARALVDAGFFMTRVHAFDLFPNTAHVEVLALFDNDGGPARPLSSTERTCSS